MDMTGWNDLYDGDVDMRAVFGFDFDMFPAINRPCTPIL